MDGCKKWQSVSSLQFGRYGCQGHSVLTSNVTPSQNTPIHPRQKSCRVSFSTVECTHRFTFFKNKFPFYLLILEDKTTDKHNCGTITRSWFVLFHFAVRQRTTFILIYIYMNYNSKKGENAQWNRTTESCLCGLWRGGGPMGKSWLHHVICNAIEFEIKLNIFWFRVHPLLKSRPDWRGLSSTALF